MRTCGLFLIFITQMKKFFLLVLLIPAGMCGQSCKPYAVIDGHKGASEITLAELSSLSKIAVEGTCHGDKYFITSYEFTMMHRGQPVSYTGWGGKLDDKIKTALLVVEPGTKIFFDNIKAKGTKGVIGVAGITLKVKK